MTLIRRAHQPPHVGTPLSVRPLPDGGREQRCLLSFTEKERAANEAQLQLEGWGCRVGFNPMLWAALGDRLPDANKFSQQDCRNFLTTWVTVGERPRLAARKPKGRVEKVYSVPASELFSFMREVQQAGADFGCIIGTRRRFWREPRIELTIQCSAE